MEFELPLPVGKAIRMLNDARYEAYIVGGCVRDFLMHRQPKDFDITTSALPQQVQKVFEGYRTIETGLQHGTVTVLVDGMPLEITTFRMDAGYSDHRHPDSVCFTPSLKQDLARRDFTMNAIAYNDQQGLIDPFGGEKDIALRLIRCVGDARKRFEEDALRIMRAMRFASTLGFAIEPKTRVAAFETVMLMEHVSQERITAELMKLLMGEDVLTVLMELSQLIFAILPELEPMYGFQQHTPYHRYDVWEHTCRVVSFVPAEPALRLAALLHDSGKPSHFSMDEQGVGHFYGHAVDSERIATEVTSRLKLDHATTDLVIRLVRSHDTRIEETEKAVRRALNKFGAALLRDLIALMRADNLAQDLAYHDQQAHYDRLSALIDQVLQQKQCFSLSMLEVSGGDLITLGFAPGKQLGQALQTLLDAVIEGTLQNKKSTLIVYAKLLLKGILTNTP